MILEVEPRAMMRLKELVADPDVQETARASGANLSRSTDRRGATSRVGYTTMSPAHREESRALHAIAVEFVKKWDEANTAAIGSKP